MIEIAIHTNDLGVRIFASYQNGTQLEMTGTEDEIERMLRWMDDRGHKLHTVSVTRDDRTHYLSTDPSWSPSLLDALDLLEEAEDVCEEDRDE